MLEPNSVLQKRYRIIKQLGQGGMGAVYEAIDQRVKCTVVLKRTLFDREDLLHAFTREARLLANLRHPALPKVMDHFVEGGGQYLVMEHIPGQDLAEVLKMLGRPFAPNEVLRWADELLRVLEYLHGMNPPILHRDIKPSNLKLTNSGEVFLLDFGLAKGAAGQMSTIGHDARSFAGYTPSYAPLEQILRSDSQHPERHWVEVLSQIDRVEVERILAAPTDQRSDLYSLGATLYQLLTNETPTHAGYRAMYVWRNQDDPVRSVAELNPLVPPEVAAIVESAMSLGPERRPPSAGAMRAALRDAGQSLRSHTGQVGFQRMPDELREAIVEDAAKRARQMLDSEFGDLQNRLMTTKAALDGLRTEVETLRKSPAETETLQKNLSRLEANVVNLQTAFDEMKRTGTAAAADVKKEEAPAARRYGYANLVFPVPVYGEDERRFHNEARRFARLLVSEIKLYNDQKLREGRENSDIYLRLREEIDRSRQMYDKRVRPEVSSRYDYYHQELVKILAEDDPSKMGRGYPGSLLKQ